MREQGTPHDALQWPMPDDEKNPGTGKERTTAGTGNKAGQAGSYFFQIVLSPTHHTGTGNIGEQLLYHQHRRSGRSAFFFLPSAGCLRALFSRPSFYFIVRHLLRCPQAALLTWVKACASYPFGWAQLCIRQVMP